MLTGKELAESGMVLNFDPQYIQQQGIDIRINKVHKLKGKMMGAVPLSGKTILPEYEEMEPLHLKNGDNRIFGWILPVGVYDIEFVEGIEVGSSFCMKPLTRSSLVRMGARVDSGLFDAGFHSKNMGAMLYVSNPVVIAKGARVAQVVCFESNDVSNLYDGQFQDDKQRADQSSK